VLEVLYHHATFGGARISPAAGVAKNVEFFVRLFVCLFVTIGPLLHAKFHPHRCNVSPLRGENLKIGI